MNCNPAVKKMKTIRYDLTLCLTAAIILLVCVIPAGASDLSGKALVETLRQGGYIIYFRHAATDWSQNDFVTTEGEWTSCDPGRMRQLSSEGRLTARRIGAAMRQLKIPIGRVLSSEYCRTRETAELMEVGPVVTTRNIMNMRVAEMVGGREAVIERAQQELGQKPPKNSNTIIVAHGNLMQAATGTYTGEAGAGVFAPQGHSRFRLVAEIAPEQWEQLANAFAH